MEFAQRPAVIAELSIGSNFLLRFSLNCCSIKSLSLKIKILISCKIQLCQARRDLPTCTIYLRQASRDLPTCRIYLYQAELDLPSSTIYLYQAGRDLPSCTIYLHQVGWDICICTIYLCQTHQWAQYLLEYIRDLTENKLIAHWLEISMNLNKGPIIKALHLLYMGPYGFEYII